MTLSTEIVEKELHQSARVIQDTLNECKDELLTTADCLIETLKTGGKILVCGNGGSAGQALLLVAELVVRYRTERQGLAAIALGPNPSVITAQGNDVGFEWIFSRQVEALGKKGDVLVAVSTSGRSPNILRAAESAKSTGMPVIALTGNKDSPLRKLADMGVFVPSGETPHIQVAHLAIIHIWCQLIDEAFRAS